MTITVKTIQAPPVLTRSPAVTLTTPHRAGSSATLNRGAGELLVVNKCQPNLHGNHLVRLLLAAYNSILKQFSSPNGRQGLFSSAPGRWGIVLRAGSPTLCCCSHYERAKSKNSSCLWKVVIITSCAVWSIRMCARLGKHCRARGEPTIKHGFFTSYFTTAASLQAERFSSSWKGDASQRERERLSCEGRTWGSRRSSRGQKVEMQKVPGKPFSAASLSCWVSL